MTLQLQPKPAECCDSQVITRYYLQADGLDAETRTPHPASPASRSDETLKIRIWPILILGFGTLIVLVALSGWLGFMRSGTTYARISELYQAEHKAQEALTQIRSDTSRSAILLRDFLLDPKLSSEVAKKEMHELRASTEEQLTRLDRLIPKRQTPTLLRLRERTVAYWSSLDPVLTRDARERSRLQYTFLQTDILPRRQAALKVVAEVQQLSAEAFLARKQDIDARNEGLAYYLARMAAVTLLIAAVVASLTVFKMHSLERMAELQHERVQEAEIGLRRLSQQLVGAQEEERKSLSRELHDQVGQVLTALRMSLGNLELSTAEQDARIVNEVELARRLVGQALRSTRDIAMGLRPAMLDDLGLAAALEWNARQHSKLYGIPVTVTVEAGLEQLSDAQKTCIYRLVQEALNNSAKYAEAQNINVVVAEADGSVKIGINDDGRGFDSRNSSKRGLGLLGMRERIAQLGGNLEIDSTPQQGTHISAHLPLVQTRA